MSTIYQKTRSQLHDERECIKAHAKELWDKGFRREVIAQKLGITKKQLYYIFHSLRGEQTR